MLSRVAQSLYWLSRYIERAENLARLVDVNRHQALEAPRGSSAEVTEDPWMAVLYATGSQPAFTDPKKKDKDLDLGRFITLEPTYPDSIRGCLAQARENARMVRDQISEEMWLELNRSYLFFQSSEAEYEWSIDAESLHQRVIEFSLLFQGLTDSTIHHAEGWQFIKLGKYLERADKTSRILDILTFLTEPASSQCAAVLRSCSALSAFREEYRGDITLEKVASFLLFSQKFPRSVRFCLRSMDELLHAISGEPLGSYSNEAERLTGSILANYNFISMDEVMRIGLHEFIDELQVKLNEIGQCIFETYVLLPFELSDAPTMARPGNQSQWQAPQQQQQQQ